MLLGLHSGVDSLMKLPMIYIKTLPARFLPLGLLEILIEGVVDHQVKCSLPLLIIQLELTEGCFEEILMTATMIAIKAIIEDLLLP